MTTSIQFTACQFNINEARTTEIKDLKNPRIETIIKTILKLNRQDVPDFCSFNELEYDQPGVPDNSCMSLGENLRLLTQRFPKYPNYSPKCVFLQGNCGVDNRALRMSNGDYYDVRNADEATKLQYGDLMNCIATLPGQYGVGFYSKYPVTDVKFITKLKWKHFNPNIDLGLYKLPPRNGSEMPSQVPDDITLFDKGLMIVTVNVSGSLVKFIPMHAVPAYNFGFAQSTDIPRNGDQIALLEWLLTGSTYFDPIGMTDDSGELLQPLNPTDKVIALGDFNVDAWQNKNALGSARLKVLINSGKFNVFPQNATTEIGTDQNGKPIDLQLDYMIARNLDIKNGSQKIGSIDPDISDHAPIMATFQMSC